MKKIIFPLAAMLMLMGYASFAQDDSTVQKQAQEAQEKAAAAQDKARTAEDKAKIEQGRADDQKKLETDLQKEKETMLKMKARIDKENRDDKLNDYDEIIIKRKDTGKDEKITVEIKNDEVFVNGKPVGEFVDDAVSVRIRSPRRFELIAPSSPFRFPYSTWSLQNGNMYNGSNGNGAFLGVLTEGTANGAKITSVTENSAAAKAGLKKDDVITKINDKFISNPQQLTEVIGEMKPDDKVKIIYLRDGKENKTTVKLGKRVLNKTFGRQYINPGEMPEPPEPGEPVEPREPNEPPPPIPPMQFNLDELGDRFNGFGDQFQKSFSFDGKPRIGIRAQDTEDGKGVKVLGVDDESAAAKAGLKENDIITSFDGKTVNSSSELADASRVAKDKSSVKIQLKRNGRNQDIELKIPKKLKTADL